MPIPESQLETWSHQGSITQSSNTYNSIKNVLEASTTPYAGKNFKVFLQGSYGNDTNIYAESDVDIVIRLDDCFHSDLESLSEAEKAAYKQSFSDATYTIPTSSATCCPS
jgi:tRNA nucleotidyltransferase (CCA-adding enzyme)